MDDLDELAASRMPAKPATDRATTTPPAKKPIQTQGDLRDAQRRAAYEEEQAAQAAAAGQDQGARGGPADANAARDKLVEAEYARRKKEQGGDELDQLALERQAAAAEIDAQNARAAMDQRSRAGLGGLGLSGAASAAEGDLARTQARSKVLTMQQFDQAAEDAKFTDVQRRAALDDLEDAAGIDYDGDGLIGGKSEAKRKSESALEALTSEDVPAFAAANKADAVEITAAEFKALPKGGYGTAVPGKDGYFYIITNETPRRFLKVKGSAVGLGMPE